jgi:hypothetical protein
LLRARSNRKNRKAKQASPSKMSHRKVSFADSIMSPSPKNRA